VDRVSLFSLSTTSPPPPLTTHNLTPHQPTYDASWGAVSPKRRKAVRWDADETAMFIQLVYTVSGSGWLVLQTPFVGAAGAALEGLGRRVCVAGCT